MANNTVVLQLTNLHIYIYELPQLVWYTAAPTRSFQGLHRVNERSEIPKCY